MEKANPKSKQLTDSSGHIMLMLVNALVLTDMVISADRRQMKQIVQYRVNHTVK